MARALAADARIGLQPAVEDGTETAPELSIVVPVYNEAENIERLYAALVDELAKVGRSYEIIVVDDGSDDGTFSNLVNLAESDPALRLLQLRRNYGQTAAIAAGFDHARGSIVVPMDGDGQNDPADLPVL